MSTRILISSLVGAIILFAWQSLSWTVLPVHKYSMKYSPNQEQILDVLSQNLSEEGMYFFPFMDPDNASSEDWQELQSSSAGKPAAMVNYIASYNNNMASSMITGFLLCLIVSIVISLSLSRHDNMGFAGRWFRVMGFAVVIMAFGTMTDKNWWFYPMHFLSGEFIDYTVMFALSGVWFAWYLGRRPA